MYTEQFGKESQNYHKRSQESRAIARSPLFVAAGTIVELFLNKFLVFTVLFHLSCGLVLYSLT